MAMNRTVEAKMRENGSIRMVKLNWEGASENRFHSSNSVEEVSVKRRVRAAEGRRSSSRIQGAR